MADKLFESKWAATKEALCEGLEGSCGCRRGF